MANNFNFVHHLPITVLILVTFTFIITYTTAVYMEHVYPLFPYISDTGNFPPESCIFSFSLNINCFLLIIIIYTRHLQVREFLKLRPNIGINFMWNTVATGFGYCGIVGLAIVANFQEGNSLLFHILGAISCFVFSTIYFFFHCIFTRKMKTVSKRILRFRIASTCVIILAFISVFAPLKSAFDQYKGKSVFMWKPKDGGYTLHLISTVAEWIMIAAFLLYITTYYWEFKNLEISLPLVQFRDQLPDDDSHPVESFKQKFSSESAEVSIDSVKISGSSTAHLSEKPQDV